MKKDLFDLIQAQSVQLAALADQIYDHPETSGNEAFACRKLADMLEDAGFSVTRGCGGMDTAFRAEFQRGSGGPAIGLLCEYDALRGLNHGCGHHIQGPAVCGAALALAKAETDVPFRIVVYGTPDEEVHGGKIKMIQNGCFKELDVALMCHGYDRTFIDEAYPFSVNLQVTYRGVTAHAAVEPEKGRSAFDALLLAFQGLEFMREHVKDGARMHYSVLDSGGPCNVVPDHATGEFCLRYHNLTYLRQMIQRFRKIVEGAAVMTETSYEIQEDAPFYGKVNVPFLNELLLKNAELVDAVRISGPRPKTGTTDFGNVSYLVPGALLGIAMAPEGTAVHTEGFLAAGKTDEAHRAIVSAAKALTATALDLILNPSFVLKIQEEFSANQNGLEKSD